MGILGGVTAILFQTDLATLVAFDPEVLRHRVRAKDDWWRVEPITRLEEVADGRVAIYGMGTEGRFRALLREGDLTDSERALAKGKLEGLGLVVTSGEVFVGAAERLPGDGRGDRMSAIPGTGELVKLEPGRYALTAWVLDWREDDAFYDEDNEPLPTAPCDVVLCARKVTDPPDPPLEVPALLDLLPVREAQGQARVPGNVRRPRKETVVRAGPVPTRQRGPRAAAADDDDGPASPEPPQRVPPPPARAPLSLEALMAAYRQVLGDPLHPPARLPAARLLLTPRDRSLQAKETSTEELLDKATRVREQMRVLEAKVNGDERLSFEDRVELEVHVTRVYEAVDELLRAVAEAAGA